MLNHSWTFSTPYGATACRTSLMASADRRAKLSSWSSDAMVATATQHTKIRDSDMHQAVAWTADGQGLPAQPNVERASDVDTREGLLTVAKPSQ